MADQLGREKNGFLLQIFAIAQVCLFGYYVQFASTPPISYHNLARRGFC